MRLCILKIVAHKQTEPLAQTKALQQERAEAPAGCVQISVRTRFHFGEMQPRSGQQLLLDTAPGF